MDLIEEITLPNNWSELVAMKDTIPFCLNKITRFPDVNQSYIDYKKNNSKEKRIQNVFDDIGDSNLKITPNKFPYSRLIQNIPKVGHFVLWSKNGEITNQQIEIEIEKVFPKKDHFWFVNPPNNKSIPEIWHCHIFVKL